MIFRFIILALSILSFSSSCYSQDKDSIDNKVFYDVDGLPIFRYINYKDESKIEYYVIDKKIVDNNIRYKGGRDALVRYSDSLYYYRKDYNYDELNAKAFYTILFDRDLKIKEIKIFKRLAYNNSKYDYDELIKRILLSTEGNWILLNNEEKHEWYFYTGSFNLR